MLVSALLNDCSVDSVTPEMEIHGLPLYRIVRRVGAGLESTAIVSFADNGREVRPHS